MLNFLLNVFAMRTLHFGLIRLLWSFRAAKIQNTETNVCTFRWNMSKNRYFVILSSRYSKRERITALLHELGHMEDMVVDKNLNVTSSGLEKRAWKKAIEFSHKYKIPLEKKVAIQWLGTYNIKSRHLENYQYSEI